MSQAGDATDAVTSARKTRVRFFGHLTDQRRLQINTNIALAIAVLIGLIVCWVHGGVETTSVAAFGAALGLGGVLGFLFGVPSSARAPVNIGRIGTVAVDTAPGSSAHGGNVIMPPAHPAAGGPGTPPPAAAPLSPNPLAEQTAVTDSGAAVASVAAPLQVLSGSPTTSAAPATADPKPATADTPEVTSGPAPSNLEQVADWVTKLLLGGGLTQMQRIPPKIWQWSHAVAMGVLGGQTAPEPQIVAEQAFACGLLVYGFVLGFFGGFLITKLQLGRAIAE